MDAIEHALMVAAYRQANGMPPPQSAPVEPGLDCLCEALEHTCRLYGIDDARLGTFLLSLALRVRHLAGETQQRQRLRQRLRQVERQLHGLLQLQSDPPDVTPPAAGPPPSEPPPAEPR